MTLSQHLNWLVVSLVIDLHGSDLRRYQEFGLNNEEICRLRSLSLEELRYLSESRVSILRLQIDHDMLNKILNRAQEEVERVHIADRALILGASTEFMNLFFGMDGVTASSRRKIKGMPVRRGRSRIPDDETEDMLWNYWKQAAESSNVTEIHSMDAFEIMMSMAEKYDIPLGTIWARVKKWNKGI